MNKLKKSLPKSFQSTKNFQRVMLLVISSTLLFFLISITRIAIAESVTNEETITNDELINNYELRITNEGQTKNEQGELAPLPSTGEQGGFTPLSEENLITNEGPITNGELPITNENTSDLEASDTPLSEEDSAEKLTKEDKKELKKLEKIQIKLKDQNLTDKQKKKLLKKIEKIQKNEISQEAKDLLNQHESKKNQLNEKFKKSNLTTSEKEEIKVELASQLSSLSEINEQLKQDSQNAINAELTEEEKAQIEYIEPNYLFEMQETGFVAPNDTKFSEQWDINWITGGKLASPTTDKQVIVAIIDTGIDYTHEDLLGQFWTSETCKDELNEPIEGGCQKGGYDFVDNDTDPYPTDNYTHGTAVAGIIAASTNNDLGIASLSNNNVKVMALRAANNGMFELDDIVSAIYFAVNNGADIINMSFGGPSYSEKLKEAIAYAKENNVLVVAAAGNYASNNDLTPIYPASFDLDNIISVAALGKITNESITNYELAYFSNYGAASVDIAAPGVNILTTTPGNTYTALSGTSFAAPMVASALSLYVADPNFSYFPVEEAIPEQTQ